MKTTLSAKQSQAVTLLAQGKQQKEVGSIIGVDENTVYRWMKGEDFRRLVTEKAKALVSDYVPEMLLNLHQLATSAQKESVRYQAARELLYMAGMKPVDVVQQIGDTEITVKLDAEDNP